MSAAPPDRATKPKPKPSVPNPCSVCGFPIFGSTVGTGDGSMKDGGSFAHPECYWRDRSERLEKWLNANHPEVMDEYEAP